MHHRKSGSPIVLSKDYDLIDVKEVVVPKTSIELIEAGDRSSISRFILWSSGILVIASCIYGVFIGDFGGLDTIWNVLGPMNAYLLGYYFSK